MSSALRASPLLVVSDLDGTLSEIAPRPELAVWVPGAAEALDRLSRAPGTHVAVVTGRALDDMASRARGMDRVWLVCDHGAVVRDPSGEVVRAPLEDRARAVLQSAAARLEMHGCGIVVERKEYSVVAHVRGLDDAAHADALELALYIAESSPHVGIEVLRGREVIELRVQAPGKRDAVETLLHRLEARALVIAGDDAPDLPMLQLAQGCPLGRAYLVRSSEGPLPPAWVRPLRSPRSWVRLLGALGRARQAR